MESSRKEKTYRHIEKRERTGTSDEPRIHKES